MEKRNSLMPSSKTVIAAFVCACTATGIKDARDKRVNSAAEANVETVLEKVEVDSDLADSTLVD